MRSSQPARATLSTDRVRATNSSRASFSANATPPSTPVIVATIWDGVGLLVSLVMMGHRHHWIRGYLYRRHQHLHRHQHHIPGHCLWIDEWRRLHLHGDCYELSGDKLSLCGDGSDHPRGNNYWPTHLASVSGYSVASSSGALIWITTGGRSTCSISSLIAGFP